MKAPLRIGIAGLGTVGAGVVKLMAENPLYPSRLIKEEDDFIVWGVVTNNMAHALKAIRTLRCGTVNINEVPGFRVESSPFGGIKDSGLGIKEGVIEAIKGYSYVKTFSLPW